MYLTSATYHKAPHCTPISCPILCLQFTTYPGPFDLKHIQPITFYKHNNSLSGSYYFKHHMLFCLCHSEKSQGFASQLLKIKTLAKSAKPMSRSDHDLHKPSTHHHNPYLYVFSHKPLTILCMCIIWQLVATSSIGHH
jgi:hypothetical protein